MAGNLCSLIAVTGKGRGPRQPEVRPDTGREAVISLHQRKGMVTCKVCKTRFPRFKMKHGLCPFCHHDRKQKIED